MINVAVSEYESSIVVEAPKDRVYEFVTTPQNMPQYLPTLKEAGADGPDRLHIRGEAGGHSYDTDGFFHLEQEKGRMSWGSDGKHKYRGWLQVDGDESKSNVTVHLLFGPGDRTEQKIEAEHEGIEDGLKQALQSIKSICESV